MQETWARPLGQEDPLRRTWHPTPVLLAGKSHGRRSLVGCSPRGRTESDTVERLPFHHVQDVYLIHFSVQWNQHDVARRLYSRKKFFFIILKMSVTLQWLKPTKHTSPKPIMCLSSDTLTLITCFFQESAHHPRGHGSQLAGLSYHCVASRDRWSDLPGQQIEGQIPGTDQSR